MATLAAGINFGKPLTEFIMESDENGVVSSCRNVVTGVEYVGGGSSDFSTATISIRPTTFPDYDPPAEANFMVPVLFNNEYSAGPIKYSQPFTVQIVLYKGSVTLPFNFLSNLAWNDDEADVSGNIRFDDEDPIAIITGDCEVGIMSDK